MVIASQTCTMGHYGVGGYKGWDRGCGMGIRDEGGGWGGGGGWRTEEDGRRRTGIGDSEGMGIRIEDGGGRRRTEDGDRG